MNIQAIMKQAQSLQKEMMKEKEAIDQTVFEGENGFVKVTVNGKKEVLSVVISEENLGKEDIELLQDMILIAMNNAMKKVDELTEQKMGKFTNSMPGLF